MSRVSRLLNQNVEIWRKTRVSDGGGGWTTSYVLHHATRARFSQPLAIDAETVIASQALAEWNGIVYFEPDDDVVRGDEIRRTGLITLKVESVVGPSKPGTYLRANCSAEQTGA